MELADIAAALQPLINTLNTLARTVDDNSRLLVERDAARAEELRQRIEESRSSEKRQARRSHWTLGIATLVLVLVGLQTYNSFLNRSILREVQSVTSDSARESGREATQDLLAGLLAEGSCDSRRQQARLPAVDPGTCRKNTPPEVYPGVAGQPARG